MALDVVAMSGAAYLTAVALDGPLLAAAYAAEAVALGAIGLRGRDSVAAWGGFSFLVLALGYGLFVRRRRTRSSRASTTCRARPRARRRRDSPRCGARTSRRRRRDGGRRGDSPASSGAPARPSPRPARSRCCTSPRSAVVTAFQPGEGAAAAGLFDLGVRQLGQLLLSALWAGPA